MSGINPPGTYTITLIPPMQSITPGIGRRYRGPFTGYPVAMLQAALTQAQDALIAVMTGSKPVSVSYAEGTGQRRVEYGKTNATDLYRLIAELERALGITRRRPISFRI
ncbi:MAG TPA: gpW family head-tail joining protein [Acidocella sp.]|jgi:hypothetical protein|uniref:gpW family head-tail joining protein n=1 Tax=Acidocella sp. TaxID=50710 RepID=UPI002C0136D0|nr:gpW family head-tail joining protein [Acidocella sp.]HVE20644.1 gpW family head-tail joining protein [Acidocella sp.]